MLRIPLLLSWAVVASTFSLNMCETALRDGRKLVPIVCEPGLTSSKTSNVNLRKLVYEATFEHDCIVIRPRRRRRKRSYVERIVWRTKNMWREFKENVQSAVEDFILR